jgi:Protein of unknown function (DUF3467)
VPVLFEEVTDAEQPQAVSFAVNVPPELDVGAYANFLTVWHSPHDFTLDFAVTQPVQPTAPGAPVQVPCSVVARVKIPTTVIFDVLRALNENMTRYEASFGEIKRPGEPSGEEQ